MGIHDIAVVKCHVIGDFTGRAMQVAVFLDISHNGTCDHQLGLVKFQLAQLIGQIVGQRLFTHGSWGVILVIAAAVVGKVAVPCHRVVVTVDLGIHLIVGHTVIVAFIIMLVTAAIIIVVVLLFLEGLNLIDLIVNELGHLGIVFLQYQAQHALLLQR